MEVVILIAALTVFIAALILLLVVLYVGLMVYQTWTKEHTVERVTSTPDNTETEVDLNTGVPLDQFTPDFNKPVKVKISSEKDAS